MTSVLAIDPGPVQSQFLWWDAHFGVERHGLVDNRDIFDEIGARPVIGTHVCIEMVESFGMAVGREVFETVFWSGRFAEFAAHRGITFHRIGRKDVKLHLCHSMRAKDPNIRQALIDRFGGKDVAIGRKSSPGPLYGISSHAWAALALAVTFADTHRPSA